MLVSCLENYFESMVRSSARSVLDKEETELGCCSSLVVPWALSIRAVVAVDNFVDIAIVESTEDRPSCLFQRNKEIVPEESHGRSLVSNVAGIERTEDRFVEVVLGYTVASVGMLPASDC